MTIELVNTGTELLLGRVVNSHQQWICRQLADRGYPVSRQAAVPDERQAIESAARDSLSRADVVIITGGLGPTSDDLTRDVISRMLGRKLREHPRALARIKALLALRKRRLSGSIRTQALVPRGARVLPNLYGTAPGLLLAVEPNPFRSHAAKSWLLALPGPGRELRPMFSLSVLPWLERHFPLSHPFVSLPLRTTGLGESTVQGKIELKLRGLVRKGLEVGYCARPGQVDVRLAARGNNAKTLLRQAQRIVLSQLGPSVFATGDITMEEQVIRLLTKRRATLAVAESCTGGCVAHRLTNVPGASVVFRAGWVTYSNQAKVQFLGVAQETLNRFGAVSEPVAREMAAGARRRAGTDYALAITGIAGPAGGTSAKPVGTVFIALATPRGTKVHHALNAWDRLTFKDVTSTQALNLVRLALDQPKSGS